jgi:flagellar FliL protein
MGDKKGNKGLMIILIITLVLVIGLASFFAYFMFFKDKSATTSKKTEKVEEKTVALDEFIINLTDNNKYIKLNIALACTDANVEAEIPTKIEQIRNEVNVYLLVLHELLPLQIIT